MLIELNLEIFKKKSQMFFLNITSQNSIKCNPDFVGKKIESNLAHLKYQRNLQE